MSNANDNPSEDRAGTGQFHTTHWSVVLVAGDSAISDSREALEKLCRTYWYPLHAYVRRQGRRPEEAQVIPLDALEAEERYRFEPVDRLDAARLFDRRWAMTVLEQAISRLETEFADRPKVFGELQSFLVGEGDGRICADAAANLGMTEP